MISYLSASIVVSVVVIIWFSPLIINRVSANKIMISNRKISPVFSILMLACFLTSFYFRLDLLLWRAVGKPFSLYLRPALAIFLLAVAIASLRYTKNIIWETSLWLSMIILASFSPFIVL